MLAFVPPFSGLLLFVFYFSMFVHFQKMFLRHEFATLHDALASRVGARGSANIAFGGNQRPEETHAVPTSRH